MGPDTPLPYQAGRTFGTGAPILILALATVVAAAVFAWWPVLDVHASAALFVRGRRFWLDEHPLVEGVREVQRLLTWGVLGVLMVLLAADRPWLRRVTRLDRRRIAVVLLTFVLGPLLGVPLLKRVFERPRPAQVQVFGGRYAFVPLLERGPSCRYPCSSFPSGEAATGFAFVSLGLATQSPSLIAAGVGLGVATGAARFVQGRHFLSDVLVTGLATMLLAVLLYRRLVARPKLVAT